MAFAILGNPSPQFVDSSGSPYASGTLAVLDPADDTNKASYPTYDDAEAATNANSNPITLDARGSCDLWGLDGDDYKLVLKDAAGATVNTDDDINLSIKGQFYATTSAETSAGVTIVNSEYEPGNVLRYGTNTTPGTTDMTTAIQNAITVSQAVYIPKGTYLVDELVPVQDSLIYGDGQGFTVLQRKGTAPLLGSSSAVTGVSVRDLTLDANSDYTNSVIEFAAGSNDARLSDIEFINFDSGSASAGPVVEWESHASTANERIVLERLFFNGTVAPTTNYQSIIVYNPLKLTIKDNKFIKCGDIAVNSNPSYGTTQLGDIIVTGNYFEDVDATNIIVRLAGSQKIENVVISDNTFYEVSSTNNKFAILAGGHQTATSGGTFRNFSITGNVIRGINANASGVAIGDSSLGATEASGFVVSGNTMDGRTAAGAINTGVITQRGIQSFGCSNVAISGNTIRGYQSFGIGISTGSFVGVSGNVVAECVRNASAGANECGIYVTQATTTHVNINGNTVVDCGAANNHGGIGASSSASITDIICSGNSVDDTRGTPLMPYGIIFGASCVRVTLGVNSVLNAQTTDIAGSGKVTYTPTNVVTDRAYNANAAVNGTGIDVAAVTGTNVALLSDHDALVAVVQELADVAGTLIADLQAKDLIQ